MAKPSSTLSTTGLPETSGVVDGVHLRTIAGTRDTARENPGPAPVVFVHGALHGSWTWDAFLGPTAERGRDAVALDWYGRNGSAQPDSVDPVTRSAADVTAEISVAAGTVTSPPVLVGHSMGALACLAYASAHPVAALVLLASPMPAAIGADPAPVPVDPTQMWGPPPFEMAQGLFFSDLDTDTARTFYDRLVPESPQVMLEAANSSLEVDLASITSPVLMVFGAADPISALPLQQALAETLGAQLDVLEGRGHGLPYSPDVELTVTRVLDWLDTGNGVTSPQ